MDFKTVLAQNKNDIAFIVGNGINRYPNNPKAISWDALLMQLWQDFSPDSYSEVPKGVSITEFYDLLELASPATLSRNEIQKRAAELLADWEFKPHHEAFIQWAQEANAPVLTTNFDLLLPKAASLHQFYTNTHNAFTDFYPWTTYFATESLQQPVTNFGIWYINGVVKYPRSIRLGLSHYMGSVEKARTLIHKGKARTNGLYAVKNIAGWQGADTWLHTIFNKPLCIFGLGIEENEVFIRWLLIERARYYKKFPDRKKQGWYIAPKKENPNNDTTGKIRFLKGIGFDLIETNSYDEIYKTAWEL